MNFTYEVRLRPSHDWVVICRRVIRGKPIASIYAHFKSKDDAQKTADDLTSGRMQPLPAALIFGEVVPE